MFRARIFFENEDAGSFSILSNMFHDDSYLNIFSKFSHSSKLTISAEPVTFAEITDQTFRLYELAFLFSKSTKFDFVL